MRPQKSPFSWALMQEGCTTGVPSSLLPCDCPWAADTAATLIIYLQTCRRIFLWDGRYVERCVDLFQMMTMQSSTALFLLISEYYFLFACAIRLSPPRSSAKSILIQEDNCFEIFSSSSFFFLERSKFVCSEQCRIYSRHMWAVCPWTLHRMSHLPMTHHSRHPNLHSKAERKRRKSRKRGVERSTNVTTKGITSYPMFLFLVSQKTMSAEAMVCFSRMCIILGMEFFSIVSWSTFSLDRNCIGIISVCKVRLRVFIASRTMICVTLSSFIIVYRTTLHVRTRQRFAVSLLLWEHVHLPRRNVSFRFPEN